MGYSCDISWFLSMILADSLLPGSVFGEDEIKWIRVWIRNTVIYEPSVSGFEGGGGIKDMERVFFFISFYNDLS